MSISIEYYNNAIQELLNEIKIIQYELDYYHNGAERRELMNKYQNIKSRVKIAFEVYFQYEVDNNLPQNLAYRRVYKSVFKA